MHSLRNRFLHVAVLALIVAGALIVGAMRPTQSSAFSLTAAITVGGITIPAADQKNVFCIQDDRFPHSYLQFNAGPKTNPDGSTNQNTGQWAFVKCTGSGGTAEAGYPQVGESKINPYFGALDFFFQGSQPAGGVRSNNVYDLYLADNTISASSLFRLTPQNSRFYPQFANGNNAGFGALFWPNVRILAGVDTGQFNNFQGDRIRSGEAFFRPFSSGPVYSISDRNIDDATDPNSGGPLFGTGPVGDYADASRQWKTTCTCP